MIEIIGELFFIALMLALLVMIWSMAFLLVRDIYKVLKNGDQ